MLSDTSQDNAATDDEWTVTERGPSFILLHESKTHPVFLLRPTESQSWSTCLLWNPVWKGKRQFYYSL